VSARARKTSGQALGPKNGGSYVAKAKAAWNPLPDWVAVLAREADGPLSLNALAAKIGGFSGGTLSAVLSHSYPGRCDKIEARVRGALMSATITCPVEGEIGRDRCADHQQQKPSAASPARARFPFACKTCPNAFPTASEKE
jgi:hypothetical protein